MLTEYIKASLKRADYKKLKDGSWYAEIPGFTGVWANGESVEECRNELQEVLEDWILFRIHKNLSLPVIDGTELTISL